MKYVKLAARDRFDAQQHGTLGSHSRVNYRCHILHSQNHERGVGRRLYFIAAFIDRHHIVAGMCRVTPPSVPGAADCECECGKRARVMTRSLPATSTVAIEVGRCHTGRLQELASGTVGLDSNQPVNMVC